MLWALAGVLVVAAGLVTFLPQLVPDAAVRREVQAVLAMRLGRPVTVDSASFRWGDGLTITGLRVRDKGEDSDALLASAKQIVIQFDPMEAARSIAGYQMPLDSVHVSGLELWLTIDKDGQTNVADLASGEPLKVRSAQIGQARVHVTNTSLRRTLTLVDVNASLGELATTGHRYFSVSGRLATTPPGEFSMTANLNRLGQAGQEPLTGSLKAEWTDAAWSQLVAMVSDESRLIGLMSATSGRAAVTFGRGAWDAEGFVSATHVVAARSELWAAAATDPAKPRIDAVIPNVFLGFQVRQVAAAKPVDVSLVRLLVPGFTLKVSGTVRLERPSGKPQDARHSLDLVGLAVLKDPDLHLSGAVTWVPFCKGIAVLEDWTKGLGLEGGAKLDVRLTATPGGPHILGSADLSNTLLVWPDVLEIRSPQTFLVKVEADLPDGQAALEVTKCDVITGSGTAGARGRLPIRLLSPGLTAPAAAGAEDAAGRRFDGAWVAADAKIKYAEGLLAVAPALARALGPVKVSGPMEVRLACGPERAGDAGAAKADAPAENPRWTARLQANLTDMQIEGPGRRTALPAEEDVPRHPRKTAGVRASLDALAALAPDARQVDIQSVQIHLAKTVLVWDGAARLAWAEEDWPWALPAAPSTGQFRGTLTVTGLESAGALLLPKPFAAVVAPVSGDAVFDVRGDLADGRLRFHTSADLEKVAVNAGDYFVKPAGRPAAVDLTGLWKFGTPVSRAEAEARIDLGDAQLTAFARGPLALEWLRLPPKEGQEASPATALSVRVGANASIELGVRTADLAKAVGLSPALKRGLEGYQTSGGAEAGITATLGQTSLDLAGSADVTGAALDLGPYLNKPQGMPMTVALSANMTAPDRDTLEFKVASAAVRLGESNTIASGLVRVSRAGMAGDMTPQARAAALFQEGDLEIHADWVHTSDLRKALPWSETLYSRSGLEGPTHLILALSGTPTKGALRLDADATACRILNAETLLKPAATPATVRLDLRYGEVPGEMILDRLAVRLADATATFDGRFLFSDPRITALAPPTAWTLRAGGQVPDAAILASLFPSRLADFRPGGAVSFNLKASADNKATQVELCDIAFKKARVEWLGRPFVVDGPVSYDGSRLAADGLNLVAGTSDVTLTVHIAGLAQEPTGSVLLRGKTLDVKECQELLRQTTEYLAARSAAAPQDAAANAAPARQPQKTLAEDLARRGQRMLARARLSAQVALDRVTIAVPQWNTTYDLSGLAAEGRLAERQFVMPRFQCAMNDGTVDGAMAIDFRQEVPLLSVAYDARNLKMADNLKPFIEATFPGLTVSGTVSTRVNQTQRLAAGSHPVGRGETVLTDGFLEGPAAPDYVAAVLPGLKMTQYAFASMSNDFENKENGDVDNRMIFAGKSYNIYIFGVTHADGRFNYQAGVDLSASLGSKVISRTLDQGKLPLLNYTGRISGAKYSEMYVQYVLPHEFAYDVFVRRNLLVQLIRRIGEKPPRIERPPVAPDFGPRPNAQGPSQAAPAPAAGAAG